MPLKQSACNNVQARSATWRCALSMSGPCEQFNALRRRQGCLRCCHRTANRCSSRVSRSTALSYCPPCQYICAQLAHLQMRQVEQECIHQASSAHQGTAHQNTVMSIANSTLAPYFGAAGLTAKTLCTTAAPQEAPCCPPAARPLTTACRHNSASASAPGSIKCSV